MNAPNGDLLADLHAALPASTVVEDPDLLGSYVRDESRFTDAGLPSAVVIPRDTAEVATTLRLAHRNGVPVVTRGAGSGLSGGANAVDGCLVLALHRMDRILDIDAVNRTVVTQPGVVTRALRTAASAAGLHYPPDPGSIDICTIGGNIATDAGGMCCVKYGVTGDFVLGLEVVLADGRTIRTGRRTVKGVAGYDLTRLFVGSEGTLGVVTEATLRLVPPPAPAATMVVSFADLVSAGDCVAAILESGVELSMMELLDRTTVRAVDEMTRMGLDTELAALLFVQSDSRTATEDLAAVAKTCEAAGAVDVAVTDDPAEGTALLEARRLALPALERLGSWLLDDVCVPRSRITDLLRACEDAAERTGLTIGVFGHAGDGNFHPTVIYDGSSEQETAAAREAFDLVTGAALELGGTITGEHGVGLLKAGWLGAEVGPENLEVQRAVKAALDPAGTLNPGKVLGPA